MNDRLDISKIFFKEPLNPNQKSYGSVGNAVLGLYLYTDVSLNLGNSHLIAY